MSNQGRGAFNCRELLRPLLLLRVLSAASAAGCHPAAPPGNDQSRDLGDQSGDSNQGASIWWAGMGTLDWFKYGLIWFNYVKVAWLGGDPLRKWWVEIGGQALGGNQLLRCRQGPGCCPSHPNPSGSFWYTLQIACILNKTLSPYQPPINVILSLCNIFHLHPPQKTFSYFP